MTDLQIKDKLERGISPMMLFTLNSIPITRSYEIRKKYNIPSKRNKNWGYGNFNKYE